MTITSCAPFSMSFLIRMRCELEFRIYWIGVESLPTILAVCSFHSDAGSLHDRGRTPNLKNTTISMASNTLQSSSARLHAPLTMQ